LDDDQQPARTLGSLPLLGGISRLAIRPVTHDPGGHCRRLRWRRAIRRRREGRRQSATPASSRFGYRTDAHARPLWHTPGSSKRKPWSGDGTTFAGRLHGARKPHCKADLNRSPRLVSVLRSPANTGENLRKYGGSALSRFASVCGFRWSRPPQVPRSRAGRGSYAEARESEFDERGVDFGERRRLRHPLSS
jgi:hypothetical protein